MADRKTYFSNGVTATIEDAENITREECLQLARAGRDAWNSWRREFPSRKNPNDVFVNTANFNVVDFRGLVVDFSGFEFGDGANFRNAKFADGVNFNDSRFGDSAQFVSADFEGFASFIRVRCGDGADFQCARFRTGVSFTESLFGRAANWRGTQIGGVSWFHGARFGERARFSGAQFEGQAHFDGAAFGDLAYFDGAQFGDLSSFRCVEFGGQITFAGKDWASVQRFYGHNFKERRDQATDLGLAPNCFAHVAFDGANFNGSVDFSGRDFTQPARFSTLPEDASFKRPRLLPADISLNKLPSVCLEEFKVLEGRPTCFAVAPRFHECKLHQDTSFDGAIFPAPRGNDGAARAYRTLKLAFSKQQAIREEQRFFKLEMQEEAARESGAKRWLYRAYDYCSDFGFSVWRPFEQLVALPAVGFAFAYLLLMALNRPELIHTTRIDQSDIAAQWLQFTFANLLPLPDSSLIKDLRLELFGKPGTWITLLAYGLETLQKLMALIAYFLMGLALRNLFKMK